MSFVQMALIGAALAGIVSAVVLELLRQRKEGRLLRELHRKLACDSQ